MQKSEGFWPSSSLLSLKTYLNGELPSELTNLDETCLCTLIALCVLESQFADQEPEWTMLAQKARTYLKSYNIDIEDLIDKLLNLM